MLKVIPLVISKSWSVFAPKLVLVAPFHTLLFATAEAVGKSKFVNKRWME